MVQCEVCGTENRFKVVTGFYYCTVCNSQSQHAVEEEFELAFDAAADGANRPLTAGRVVGLQQRSKRDAGHRRLRSYRRLSLYNDLLRRMVDELIQLGAPPRLKVVVVELWFKYIDVLELDSEPYGKLPPFCLKEEFEMAAKKIKEDSFGLKVAVFNHISMRYGSAYKQKHNDVWYKKHSTLCGYEPAKTPQVQPGGLGEIISDLSTDNNASSRSLSISSREGDEDLINDGEDDILMKDNAGEASGFGFGTLHTTEVSFGEELPQKEKGKETAEWPSSLTHKKPPEEEEEEGLSFSFAQSVVQPSSELPPGDGVPMDADRLAESTNEHDKPEAAAFSMDIERESGTTQIEQVDLTSGIAYKLKEYMESREQQSIERYQECVLQMHSSSLVMILYLALVRAKAFHIGICDIYRFIRQRALTFREPREAVPDDLLKWRKNLFFSMSLPDIYPIHTGMGSFVRSTSVLCALLEIPELEMPPLEYFVARIGLDLNLPGEIRSMAVSICRTFSLQPSWRLPEKAELPFSGTSPVPLMELEACAVLLFVLKFLFGIDGKTEYAASLEAERRSHEDGVSYFVISRWLTQLSRRAYFLRRRGEFYTSAQRYDFEHIRSVTYLVRHEAKRRSDFYQRGMAPRRCARFIDDIDVEDRPSPVKLPPSSWPLTSALKLLVDPEDPADRLHLLEDMTTCRVIMKQQSSFPAAFRTHGRFFTSASRMPGSIDTASVGSSLSPPVNLRIITNILGEYALTSGLRLHRSLMRVESIICKESLLRNE